VKFLPVYFGSVFIFAAVATSASAATQQLSPVYATSYGVTCNGTTDDTAAMQAAHNTGRVVIYPAGTCKFSTLTIASGGIVGEGVGAFPGQPGGTFLLTTDKGQETRSLMLRTTALVVRAFSAISRCFLAAGPRRNRGIRALYFRQCGRRYARTSWRIG